MPIISSVRRSDGVGTRPRRIYVRAAASSRAPSSKRWTARVYASTGVELAAYDASATGIAIKVKSTTFSKSRVQFIGREGRVLAEQTEPSPVTR